MFNKKSSGPRQGNRILWISWARLDLKQLYYIIFGNFKFIKESDSNKLYYTLKTKRFTKEDSKRIGESLGIDWTRFDTEQFRMGLDVELEHGSYDSLTNVSNDHEIITGKIALHIWMNSQTTIHDYKKWKPKRNKKKGSKIQTIQHLIVLVTV